MSTIVRAVSNATSYEGRGPLLRRGRVGFGVHEDGGGEGGEFRPDGVEGGVAEGDAVIDAK